MEDPQLPSADGFAGAHANWLEWRALCAADQYASYSDHLSALGVASDEDQMDDADSGVGDELDNVVAELSDRERACDGAYPFEVGEYGLRYCAESGPSTYRFMLLLSFFGKDAGPKGTHGDRIFERLCMAATQSYLGGDGNPVGAEVFGSPRPELAAGFKDALGEVCRLLGEGGGYRRQSEKVGISSRTSGGHSKGGTDAKDASLDIVAWRPFSDVRAGKLIIFGQCATGRNWSANGKLTELHNTAAWCTQWLLSPPLVTPVRAFYMPHTVERHKWEDTCLKGGLIFERCRIATLARHPEDRLARDIERWADHVQEARNRP